MLSMLPLIQAAAIGATIHVPGDQSTIAQAVQAAAPGDTIMIAAGTYQEGNIFPSVSPLSIIGEVDADGLPAVTLDGENTTGILIGIGVVGSEDVTLENLRFTGSQGNALWIYHMSPLVQNCVFSDITTNNISGTAIWASDSRARFESCQFFNIDAGLSGSIVNLKGVTGLNGNDQDVPSFASCIFENNSCYSVVSTQFWDVLLDTCTLRDNTANSVLASHQGIITLAHNLLCNNTGTPISGDWVDAGGNTITDQCPISCSGDYDLSGEVDVTDLLLVIAEFGNPYSVTDVLIVIANWGPCP